MTKQQKLGQLRALLTAAGTFIAAWGYNDPSGQDWQPIVGIFVAFVSITWGLLHHRDPDKSGTIKWSLVRKLANSAGSAAIGYGAVHPDKVANAEMFIAALGPLLAAWFSWIDNSPGTDDDDGYGEPDPPRKGDVALWLIFLAASCLIFLPGCTVTVAPDGTVSATIDDAPAAVRVIEVLSEK